MKTKDAIQDILKELPMKKARGVFDLRRFLFPDRLSFPPGSGGGAGVRLS
jgi:hypothetical protein